LKLCPSERQTLIAVIDDATSRMLFGKLFEAEDTRSVMEAMLTVTRRQGVPMAYYTDRARWAFLTPLAGEEVDRVRLTQVGRALARLGVEHIPAYTPQARGRSERLNGTLQDRLVNELKAAGIRTVAEANRYIDEVYIPRHNELFARAPRESASAFVSAGGTDLEQIFCIEEARVVSRDYTVAYESKRLQLELAAARAARPGTEIIVHEHLDGTISLWRGKRELGHYQANGELLTAEDNKKSKPRVAA
jgi:hypothetical protein